MRLLGSLQLALIGLLGIGGLAMVSGSGRAGAGAAQTEAVRRPVLVELFTSEGCSSCPPADALLARLDSTQFVPGAQAIVLSEHVTYWNQDGWHDPFSSDAMTDRQKDYRDRFGLSDVYTPQAVVDGAVQMVGSDERKLTAAVEQAAAATRTELAIQDAQWAGNAVKFSVKGNADAKTMLTAALAEDAAQIAVKAGENKGLSLRHVAVVRTMQEMGKGADDGRPLSIKAPSGKDAGTGPMRLVVFVADRHNGHVMAAAERTINR